MTLILISFFLSCLIIFFSVVGYGLAVSNLLKFQLVNYNLGILGILGLFILSIISSLTHLLIQHGYLHNSIIISIGIIFILLFD